MKMTMALGVLALSGSAFAGSILQNSGFEPVGDVPNYNALPGGSTAIDGWTTTDTGAEWFDAAAFGGASPDGGFAVDVANFTFSAGGIEQVVSLTVGDT